MFSMITSIYNKKTKRPALMELFTATGKLNFFFQLEMFDVCTKGDTAHIDTIFNLLPHTRQHVDTCVATSLVVKKNFFSFTVVVKNSIKVGDLVFLL